MLEYNHAPQAQQEFQRLEGERQALIRRLGESMYGMWRSNQFSREEFEALCRDIRRCEEGMDVCRPGPEAHQPPPPAPGWGQPQTPPPGPIPGPQVPPRGPDMGQPGPRPTAPPGAVCPCGNLNPAGARFCTKCGRPL